MTRVKKGQAIGMGLATLVTGLLLMPRKNGPVDDNSELPSPVDDIRAEVVRIAKGEIGQQDPAKYWETVLPGTYTAAQIAQYAETRDWCGGFALWCIKQAGLAPDMNWKDGKGFCYQLPITSNPKPGDVAYFGAPLQHHAIVAEVQGDDLITVDGNFGSYVSGNSGIRDSVALKIRKVSSATAFYSIEGLIRAYSA